MGYIYIVGDIVMKERERDCDRMKLENVIAAHTKLHYSGSIEQI